jgi:hypothetical protein
LAVAVAVTVVLAAVVPADAHAAADDNITRAMTNKTGIAMSFFMRRSLFCVLDEPSVLSIFKYINFHMLPCLFFVVNHIFLSF